MSPGPYPIIDRVGTEVLRWRGLGADGIEAIGDAFDALAGRTVLVTGSAGSIGGQLARRLAGSRIERLVLVDASEAGQFRLDLDLASTSVPREICLGDVGDEPFVDHVFERFRPQVVLHAAAYKHVPMLEGHPRQAVRSNVLGTRCVAEAADRWGSERLVMVSTDKAVSPAGVMGASKKLAELYLRTRPVDAGCRFSSVRFGNVIESSGNVFEVFARQLELGQRLTVTDSRAERYFMTLAEAAALVARAASLGAGGEVFVLNMGQPVSIERIARRMAELAGRDAADAVEFVGLRPGEQMDERLFESHEHPVATGVPGIRRAEGPIVDAQLFESAIAMLEDAASTGVDGVGECLARAIAMVECHPAASGVADAN